VIKGGKAYRRKHSGEELPLDMPHRARLNELERHVKELKQENAFLKKGVPRTREAA
jgi:transposase